jgi:hypothetical protein
VSPSCEPLLGYSQAEMEHINYNDLVHADNRNEAREAVRRLLDIARGGTKELPNCQQVFPLLDKVILMRPYSGVQNEKTRWV